MINKMALNERSSTTFSGGAGGSFWGLVQQKGPWKTTYQDRLNARGRSGPVLGGGIGAGGTRNAGHGNYEQLMNPYQQNGSKPPPMPSKYAQRQVVASGPDMYQPKATAGIRSQFKPSVGNRASYQTNQKMGSMGKSDEGFQGGARTHGMAPEKEMPGMPQLPNYFETEESPGTIEFKKRIEQYNPIVPSHGLLGPFEEAYTEESRAELAPEAPFVSEHRMKESYDFNAFEERSYDEQGESNTDPSQYSPSTPGSYDTASSGRMSENLNNYVGRLRRGDPRLSISIPNGNSVDNIVHLTGNRMYPSISTSPSTYSPPHYDQVSANANLSPYSPR